MNPGYSFQDLTGKRFGRLTVLSFSHKSGKRVCWLCQCDCGETKVAKAICLTQGATRSCGCLRREQTVKRFRTHGHTKGRKKTPEYKAWLEMRRRCLVKNKHNSHRYSERGILVCQRWLDSFEAFLADMGKRPSCSHSIDRIDNDGNYEPENCRWATKRQQSRNQRTNHLVSYQGLTLTLSEWSERTGIKTSTIRERLRRGWPEGDALSKPVPN